MQVIEHTDLFDRIAFCNAWFAIAGYMPRCAAAVRRVRALSVRNV